MEPIKRKIHYYFHENVKLLNLFQLISPYNIDHCVNKISYIISNLKLEIVHLIIWSLSWSWKLCIWEFPHNIHYVYMKFLKENMKCIESYAFPLFLKCSSIWNAWSSSTVWFKIFDQIMWVERSLPKIHVRLKTSGEVDPNYPLFYRYYEYDGHH